MSKPPTARSPEYPVRGTGKSGTPHPGGPRSWRRTDPDRLRLAAKSARLNPRRVPQATKVRLLEA